MPYQILIDGYNLLFTAGFEGRGRGPGWLEQARQRLKKYLETHLPREDHARTLVVFDVSVDVLKSRERQVEDVRGAETNTSSGIQVAFAFDFDEADDMLENLIRQHSSPKSLTVVSSDHRIRKCALARRAISITSDDFLNRLERSINGTDAAANEEAARTEIKLSENEVQEWLREFGEDATG